MGRFVVDNQGGNCNPTVGDFPETAASGGGARLF